MTLTINELFTPAASGVGQTAGLPPPDGTWLAILLFIANTVGLPTTAWEPGGPERTILEITAVAFAQDDATISKFAQGGFLQFAAFGTVSYVDTVGNTITAYVTPDPSVPSQNPNGAPGWLDALCQSYFDEDRLQATTAAGQLAIVNTTAGTLGPYAPGTYHAANTVSKATYANAASLTIPASKIGGTGGVITGVTTGTTTTITTQSAHGLAAGNVVYFLGVGGVTGLSGVFGQVAAVTATSFSVRLTTSGAWTSGGQVYQCTIANMVADVIGTASNAAPGQVTTLVTQAAGAGVTNITSWSASNYESNAAYAARCQSKLGSLSPNGPSQAYEYFALTAARFLAEEAPPVTLSNGSIAQALASGDPITGNVLLTIASATPASSTTGQAVTPGCTQLPIIGATNASPIVIQTAAPHNLLSTNFATIVGVLGNTGANGTWTITVVDASHFSLDNSSGTGAYTASTGIVEGGDLGEVDGLIQSRVVNDGTTAITRSALALGVAIAATVLVPQSFVATYTAAAQAFVSNYVASLEIGGFVEPGTSVGIVPIAGVEGALQSAGVVTAGANTYVKDVSALTLNGAAADLSFPTGQYQAVVASIVLSVIGV